MPIEFISRISKPALNKLMKEKFTSQVGTNEAQWLLEDGTLIGGFKMGHSSVCRALPEKENAEGLDACMSFIMTRGNAIRIRHFPAEAFSSKGRAREFSIDLDTANEPSEEQLSVLRQGLRDCKERAEIFGQVCELFWDIRKSLVPRSEDAKRLDTNPGCDIGQRIPARPSDVNLIMDALKVCKERFGKSAN